jgi:hypothetical protein
MTDLPSAVAELVDVLAGLPGAIAVVLGGSHALGSADTRSDWDLGLYYRHTIDLTALTALGTVHPPGSWGRVMNGGAWLHCEGYKVDVILRDLDIVEHWTRQAEHGEFDVDSLLGYLAGIPTYTLTAELASCRLLRGDLPAAPRYASTLMASGAARWRFCRTFSLDCARMHAARGNVAGAIGHTARAAMEEAHAILCERGEWVCNEKRLIEAAGLTAVQSLFARTPQPSGLVQWVNLVADRLGVPAGETSPWTDVGRKA